MTRPILNINEQEPIKHLQSWLTGLIAILLLFTQAPIKPKAEVIKTPLLTSERVDVRHYTKLTSNNQTNNRNIFVLGDSLDTRNHNENMRIERDNQTKRETISRQSPSLRYDPEVKIIGESSEQCVQYFKRVSGIQRPLGYAGSIQSQGQEPRVGAGALWKNYGHIGYVVVIEGDYLIINDSNWLKGKITQHRLLMSDVRGFIYN